MSAETSRLNPGDVTRTVSIPAGSVALEGELAMPDVAGGIVIFAHGSGSSRHSPRNQAIARHLRRQGLGTLLFDMLTPEEESTVGPQLRFNIGLLTQRLVSATHWLAGEDEARHLRLGFFGSNTGGGAALVAAADLGRDIGAVVTRGARVDLAGGALRRVKCPTLLIVGELDTEVRELNEESCEMLTCERHLTVVRGAKHLFEEPGALDEVARLGADWLNHHLGAFPSSRLTANDWDTPPRG